MAMSRGVSPERKPCLRLLLASCRTVEKKPSAAEPEPPLKAALTRHGIDAAQAAKLIGQHEAAHLQTMIEYLEFEMARKPGKIADPAAWLVSAIRDGRSKPKGFVSAAERQRREEEKRRKEQAAADKHRRQRAQEARERDEQRMVADHLRTLTAAELAKIDAATLAQADAETLALEKGPFRETAQRLRREAYIRQRLRDQGTLPPANAPAAGTH
jgi:hypothetical protein